MTRITTIPFSFTAAANSDNYYVSQPLPLPYRILHLYALGSPAPNMLVYVMLSPYGGQTLPLRGQPGGPTIFDDIITRPPIRLGPLPVDMDLDITVTTNPNLMCYLRNDNPSQQQAMIQVLVSLP